ncbi:MAG: ABC transporter substrate-binding protein, partial [Spirochaetaceae bacterium]|nr:ABC transporter substrate-binding protein [Spirochaetaceae bacterium]
MLTKSKKWGFLFLALLLSALSGWASAKRDAPQEPREAQAEAGGTVLSGKKVIVADANSTHHLNLYVAYEKGLFAKRGLEVEIQQTSSGVAAVVGGEADIVFNCPTGVITPIARGQS